MKIFVTKGYKELSRMAADIISSTITKNPNATLGLATGSSPLLTYENLIEDYKAAKISFSGVTSINLDEYVGLPATHPQSYAYFMQENLFSKVDIKKENIFIPNGMETDSRLECERYDNIIASKGPIDLQLLGLGENGHIGFNEPNDFFPNKTHLVKLTESTIQANSRLFNSIEEVPTYAYSMGVGAIMSAKSILLIVSGQKKAKALFETIRGSVTPRLPASILQFHSDVTIIADEAAYSLIV